VQFCLHLIFLLFVRVSCKFCASFCCSKVFRPKLVSFVFLFFSHGISFASFVCLSFHWIILHKISFSCRLLDPQLWSFVIFWSLSAETRATTSGLNQTVLIWTRFEGLRAYLPSVFSLQGNLHFLINSFIFRALSQSSVYYRPNRLNFARPTSFQSNGNQIACFGASVSSSVPLFPIKSHFFSHHSTVFRSISFTNNLNIRNKHRK
jgi:hypothetical protein